MRSAAGLQGGSRVGAVDCVLLEFKSISIQFGGVPFTEPTLPRNVASRPQERHGRLYSSLEGDFTIDVQ